MAVPVGTDRLVGRRQPRVRGGQWARRDRRQLTWLGAKIPGTVGAVPVRHDVIVRRVGKQEKGILLAQCIQRTQGILCLVARGLARLPTPTARADVPV